MISFMSWSEILWNSRRNFQASMSDCTSCDRTFLSSLCWSELRVFIFSEFCVVDSSTCLRLSSLWCSIIPWITVYTEKGFQPIVSKYSTTSHKPQASRSMPTLSLLIGLRLPTRKLLLSINFSSLGRTERSPCAPLFTGRYFLTSKRLIYLIVTKSTTCSGLTATRAEASYFFPSSSHLWYRRSIATDLWSGNIFHSAGPSAHGSRRAS